MLRRQPFAEPSAAVRLHPVRRRQAARRSPSICRSHPSSWFQLAKFRLTIPQQRTWAFRRSTGAGAGCAGVVFGCARLLEADRPPQLLGPWDRGPSRVLERPVRPSSLVPVHRAAFALKKLRGSICSRCNLPTGTSSGPVQRARCISRRTSFRPMPRHYHWAPRGSASTRFRMTAEQSTSHGRRHNCSTPWTACRFLSRRLTRTVGRRRRAFRSPWSP